MINEINCIGCGACAEVCPKKCISLTRDGKGFLVAEINDGQCVRCNKCDAVCPNKTAVERNVPKECIAAYSIQPQHVMNSSSGGVFTVLAEQFISEGGAVYGAAFDDKLGLSHVCVTESENLAAIRGSKYIQSDVSAVLADIKTRLASGQTILFSGTPCQTAAVSLLCDGCENRDNLTLVDIVCHGTPSNRLFGDYIADIERRQKSKVTSFRFRSKKLASTLYGFEYLCKNGTSGVSNGGYTPFGKAFFNGLAMRDSCYNCRFSCSERVGDLTVGDYWGCANDYPDFYNRNGTSCVLVNTERGARLLGKVKDRLQICETDIERVKKNNHNLNSPTEKNPLTEQFWKDYDEKGYEYIHRKYLKNSFMDKVRIFVHSFSERK